MLENFLPFLVIALAGAALMTYIFLNKKKESQATIYDPTKDEPTSHIRKKLFFEIPIEMILIAYFALIAITYILKLIFSWDIPEVNLAVLYFSGIAFFLSIYKLGMGVGVVNKFNVWLLTSSLFACLIFLFAFNELVPFFPEILENTYEYHRTIHLLGLTMGLGGTLIIDLMFSHFMRKYKIVARESVLMHLISQMIILGLVLLILSGIALLALDMSLLFQNPRFQMKIVLVLIVIVNGLVLNLYVTPRMKTISLKAEDKREDGIYTKLSFAFGAVSLVAWGSVFLLAMLKDLFNQSFLYLFLGFLVLLVGAIIASQLAKKYYIRKEGESVEKE